MSEGSFDLPPILPDVREQLEEYLICPEKLPIHEYERNQEFWPRDVDVTSLFHFDGSPICTTLKVYLWNFQIYSLQI